jgi:hypothetical protein
MMFPHWSGLIGDKIPALRAPVSFLKYPCFVGEHLASTQGHDQDFFGGGGAEVQLPPSPAGAHASTPRNILVGSKISSVSTVTRLRARRLGIRFRADVREFFLFIVCRPALGRTHPLIQGYRGSFPEGKAPSKSELE